MNFELNDFLDNSITLQDVQVRDGEKRTYISGQEMAKVLVEKSSLKHLKIYPHLDKFFIYNPKKGIYREFNSIQLKVLICGILKHLKVMHLEQPEYLGRIVSVLKVSYNCNIGNLQFDKRYIVHKNGVYDLHNKRLVEHSPLYFTTIRNEWDYDPAQLCPQFEDYLNTFTKGFEDRKLFLLAWLAALTHGWTDSQTFLYIEGPGATGKSMFGTIAKALVGLESTITTTLKALNSDPFEISNLMGKRLILISETERYKGDLSVLKMITGGDTLKGRVKFVQGAFEVQPEGLVLIIGNRVMETTDSSSAILRRMRVFRADNVVSSREPLLYYNSFLREWQGPLSKELPGIFNKVLTFDKTKALAYLNNTRQLVPSFTETFQESEEAMNPLYKWAREELMSSDSGSYVGYKISEDIKGQVETSRRKALYPTYSWWAKRNSYIPLGYHYFTSELVEVLSSLGIPTQKVRRKEGYYIKGVAVQPHIYDRDYTFGAPLFDKPVEGSGAAAPAPSSGIEKVASGSPEDTVAPSAAEATGKALSSGANEVSASSKEEISATFDPGLSGMPSSSYGMKAQAKDEFDSSKASNPNGGLGAGPQTNGVRGVAPTSSNFTETTSPKIVTILGENFSNDTLKVPNSLGKFPQHPRLFQDLYDLYNKALMENEFKKKLNAVSRKADLNATMLTKALIDECKVGSSEFKARMHEQIEKSITQVLKFGAIPYTYKQMGLSPRIIPQSYGKSFNSTKRIVREATYKYLGASLRSEGYSIIDFDLVSCYTSILLGLYPQELRSIQLAVETIGIWNYIRNEFVQRGKEQAFNKLAVKICVYSSFFLGGDRAMMQGILEFFRKDLGFTQKQFLASSYYEECYTIAREIATEMSDSSIIVDFRDLSNYIYQANKEEYLVGPTGHGYLVTEHTFKGAYPNYLISYEFALLAQTTLEVMKEFPDSHLIGHFHDGNVIVVPTVQEEAFICRMSEVLANLGHDLGLRYKQKIEVKSIYK